MNNFVKVFSRDMVGWLYWSLLISGFTINGYELLGQSQPNLASIAAINPRRQLYNVVQDQSVCRRCQNLGKQVCWDVHPDGTGEWDQSFCCGTLGE